MTFQNNGAVTHLCHPWFRFSQQVSTETAGTYKKKKKTPLTILKLLQCLLIKSVRESPLNKHSKRAWGKDYKNKENKSADSILTQQGCEIAGG